jgi:hypothetical protein
MKHDERRRAPSPDHRERPHPARARERGSARNFLALLEREVSDAAIHELAAQGEVLDLDRWLPREIGSQANVRRDLRGTS